MAQAIHARRTVRRSRRLHRCRRRAGRGRTARCLIASRWPSICGSRRTRWIGWSRPASCRACGSAVRSGSRARTSRRSSSAIASSARSRRDRRARRRRRAVPSQRGRASRPGSRERGSRSGTASRGCGGRATSTSTASSARPGASSARATRSRTPPTLVERAQPRGAPALARPDAGRVPGAVAAAVPAPPAHAGDQHRAHPPLRAAATCPTRARSRWMSCAARICATRRTRCCAGGWPRRTIDGAFSALSARAARRGRHRAHRRQPGGALARAARPTRGWTRSAGEVRRRAVPPAEIHAFIAEVAPGTARSAGRR